MCQQIEQTAITGGEACQTDLSLVRRGPARRAVPT